MNQSKRQKCRRSRKQAEWLQRRMTELAELRAYREMQEDFMAYMTAELDGFKCLHGDKNCARGTPPMMWPELIACIAKRAAKDALAKHGITA